MNQFVFYTITAFFSIGALWHGLFYDVTFLVMNVFMGLGSIIYIILKKEIIFTKFHLAVLLFVLAYWAALFYAVDFEQALLEASRVTMLIPLSLMMSLLSVEKTVQQSIQLFKSWVWIGAVLTILGLINQLYRDNRLESMLGYANALAILLLVAVLISIVSYIKEKRWLYLGLLTVNATGLLLTFSRSVWVLWLLAAIVMIVIVPELRNKTTLVKIGLAHLTSFLAAVWIKQDLLFFWQRVQSIQTGTSEFQIRLVYWKDSLRMLQDYWVGGTGGGGWSVLQHLYQSQEYYVKFIHNHYIQIALDLGVLGVILFTYMIFLFYKNILVHQFLPKDKTDNTWNKAIVVTVTVMLLHAGFDFDLSFPLLFGMLICLMNPGFSETKLKKLSIKSRTIKSRKILTTIVLLNIMLSTIFFAWMTAGYGLKESGMKAISDHKYAAAQQYFNKAERMLPWSSSILYESAKGYVLMGNESGDMDYYNLAVTKLESARLMVPEQSLYEDLLEDLEDLNSRIK